MVPTLVEADGACKTDLRQQRSCAALLSHLLSVSSVHAHWAAFRADLVLASEATGKSAALMDDRLTEGGLKAVEKELTEDKAFEMPYGRAWLLRLASEHDLWAVARGKDATRVRALGDFSAKSLMDHYENNAPNPSSSDYDNDPWAISQLYAWFRHTGDQASAARVRKWVELEFVTSPETWATTNDADPTAFFSRYWSYVYAVSQILPASEALTLLDPGQLEDAALKVRRDQGASDATVHNIGINWSRAWAIRSLAKLVVADRGQDDEVSLKLVRAYHEHVKIGRQRHETYVGRYRDYDHWVPQFGIYTITD